MRMTLVSLQALLAVIPLSGTILFFDDFNRPLTQENNLAVRGE